MTDLLLLDKAIRLDAALLSVSRPCHPHCAAHSLAC
jgi:hypothetical protein